MTAQLGLESGIGARDKESVVQLAVWLLAPDEVEGSAREVANNLHWCPCGCGAGYVSVPLQQVSSGGRSVEHWAYHHCRLLPPLLSIQFDNDRIAWTERGQWLHSMVAVKVSFLLTLKRLVSVLHHTSMNDARCQRFQ